MKINNKTSIYIGIDTQQQMTVFNSLHHLKNCSAFFFETSSNNQTLSVLERKQREEKEKDTKTRKLDFFFSFFFFIHFFFQIHIL